MLRPVVKETSPRANFPTGLVYLGMMRGVEKARENRESDALWNAIADLRKEIAELRRPWYRKLWERVRHVLAQP